MSIKLKFLVLSDLHLEVVDFIPSQETIDAIDGVILAGDIGSHTHGFEWAIRWFSEKFILYVPGNHEFYDAELHGIRKELQKKASEARKNGIQAWVLDNDSIEIAGVKFFGTTLWTDYKLFGIEKQNALMNLAQHDMPDHHYVRCSPLPKFTAKQALHLNRDALSWLTSSLNAPYHGKKVVITHHVPTFLSVAEKYKDSYLSAAFASNFDYLVKKSNIWIHGHTHETFDYFLNQEEKDSRVICNPRGYCRIFDNGIATENSNFNPDFIVEI